MSLKYKPLSEKVLMARIRLAMRHPLSVTPAMEIIAQALKHRVYVAWSGGRCSTVALHLTLEMAPEIPVVFCNTGVEYPETVEYVRTMADEWGLNFHELNPERSFWDVVEEYGFPQLRGSSKKRGGGKPACCKYLKVDPPKQFMKANDLVGFISGLRVEESRPRALAIFQKGPYYYTIRDGLWKFHPVALWTLKELNGYIAEKDIPLNPLYERGLPRVGCMPCTGFIGWRQQLAKTKPKFFKWLNREFQKSVGEPTLWEYEDIYDICDEDERNGV